MVNKEDFEWIISKQKNIEFRKGKAEKTMRQFKHDNWISFCDHFITLCTQSNEAEQANIVANECNIKISKLILKPILASWNKPAEFLPLSEQHHTFKNYACVLEDASRHKPSYFCVVDIFKASLD